VYGGGKIIKPNLATSFLQAKQARASVRPLRKREGERKRDTQTHMLADLLSPATKPNGKTEGRHFNPHPHLHPHSPRMLYITAYGIFLITFLTEYIKGASNGQRQI